MVVRKMTCNIRRITVSHADQCVKTSSNSVNIQAEACHTVARIAAPVILRLHKPIFAQSTGAVTEIMLFRIKYDTAIILTITSDVMNSHNDHFIRRPRALHTQTHRMHAIAFKTCMHSIYRMGQKQTVF